MDAIDKVFAGSIPELYDRLLVPMIFAPYAEDLARRVAALADADAGRPVDLREFSRRAHSLKGAARTRVVPNLPWSFNFNDTPIDVPNPVTKALEGEPPLGGFRRTGRRHSDHRGEGDGETDVAERAHEK